MLDYGASYKAYANDSARSNRRLCDYGPDLATWSERLFQFSNSSQR